jgi:predicted permease
MDDLLPIALKVLAVFAVMGAGVGARLVGWLTAEADRSLMKLTVNVLIPCLFFSRVLGAPSLATPGSVGVPPIVGFVTTVLGFIVAGLAAYAFWRLLGLPTPQHRRSFTLCTGMYNYGYISLPLAEKFYPTAVATLMVHNVGVEIALWTVGILVISGGLGPGWWKRILNPPAVAIAAAVGLNFAGAAGPIQQHAGFILEAADLLGRCAIPMGLVLSGAIIVDLMREMKLTDGLRTLAGATLIRVVLLPIAFLAFARYAPISTELKQVMVLQASMPAAMFPIVVAKMYEQDTQTALKIIVGTTLMGLLTIPLWIIVGRAWVGV